MNTKHTSVLVYSLFQYFSHHRCYKLRNLSSTNSDSELVETIYSLIFVYVSLVIFIKPKDPRQIGTNILLGDNTFYEENRARLLERLKEQSETFEIM